MASWSPYKIDQSADFFDPKIMFGLDSFDLVIGNPPYIQLQKFKDKGYPFDASKYPHTFVATGDIYCIFYERAYGLLNNKGICSFITSNKWMRAGYGSSTRKFLANNTIPLQLIDLGSGVFESATVDSNILIYKKEVATGHSLEALKLEKGVLLEKLKRVDFAKLSDLSEDNWLILSQAEQELKKKIESKGKVLKEWDVKINYGIKTGCNEAFIINQVKYDELVAKDPKSKEILKPLLRGKDIARYETKWARLYLIFIPWHFPLHNNTITGVLEKAENLFKKEYTVIYNHLKEYKEKLSLRNKAETGIRYEWYALQRCAATYYEEFSKHKIIYCETTKFLPFIYDEEYFYIDKTCFMITSSRINLLYLIGYMNSKVSHYWIKQNCPELQGGSRGLVSDTFKYLPIPVPTPSQEEAITNLANQILEAKKQGLETNQLESEIDKLVYEMYVLSEEEIKTVENC